MIERPQRGEIGDYFFRYIDLVPEGSDVLEVIESQRRSAAAFLGRIGEEQSRHRYAPGKWSMRQVLGHVADTELVFLYRALWFARGFADALPSFDEKPSAERQGADEVSWASLSSAFDGVRAATIGFCRNLPPDAWSRSGIASGNPFTVRGLAFVIAGHLSHHESVLRERYLAAGGA
jgi:DinB family protein